MRMDTNTQLKRLRRNSAAQASDDSKSSDDEVQQICDLQNSSEAETEDESEVAEISLSSPSTCSQQEDKILAIL